MHRDPEALREGPPCCTLLLSEPNDVQGDVGLQLPLIQPIPLGVIDKETLRNIALVIMNIVTCLSAITNHTCRNTPGIFISSRAKTSVTQGPRAFPVATTSFKDRMITPPQRGLGLEVLQARWIHPGSILRQRWRYIQ